MHLHHLAPLVGLATATSRRQPAPAVSGPRITLTVDPSATFQTIDGFGFCEAFQRAHAITNLPSPWREEVLDLLFNTTTGAGFSILRLGLGSSPDSRGDHMNSPQPNADGPFAWDRKDSGQLWVAKQAQRYGVQTFIADAWSAPGYMKTNGRDDMGGWLCGVRGEGSADGTECKGVSWVQAYAEYLARYVLAWVDEGIPIVHVGFVNEPNLIKPYATMQSDGYQAAEQTFALSVALGGIGLPSVGISCCEGQGWSYARDILAEIQDAGAEGALSLITTHTYKGTPAKPDRPLDSRIPVWVTEISPIMDRLGMTQTWYRNSSENEGLLSAINIHEALVTGNASAYVYWIGVGQSSAEAPFIWAPNLKKNVTYANMWWPNDDDTVIEVPAGTAPYTIGSTYWASAQFSRFVRPGAKRIGVRIGGVSNYTATLLASAYQNKNSGTVVQVINNGDQHVTAYLSTPSLGGDPAAVGRECQLDTWVTDDERKLELIHTATSGPGIEREVTVSRRSLSTFVLKCG
ncbi:glycoside hydrolase superfamily [Lasiosphaeris hirsuta]|uniref:Glycoside hydrolase superfamily n=1 Tax=Lasiosphaeris hirsuta TaxID=260670 RepID=A0AA40E8Z6_9PEZI|nr:glycoside hydrolase superfamily [Lasiosphaeris hirsuta]